MVRHFGDEVPDIVGGAAEHDDVGPFIEAGAGDGLADAGSAPGDYDDVLVEAEIHSVMLESRSSGRMDSTPDPLLPKHSAIEATFLGVAHNLRKPSLDSRISCFASTSHPTYPWAIRFRGGRVGRWIFGAAGGWPGRR